MRFNPVSFIYFLALYAFRCMASCPTSKETITYVSSCPKTLAEWKWRAEAKKCWLVKQQCTQPNKFVYHCVINSYANSTLEVCAQAVHVIGHSCVEFNMLGGLVQDSPYLKCKTDCPFSYNSTDVYKYQMCFDIANIKEERTCSHCICPSSEYPMYNSSVSRKLMECNPNFREVTWQIVAIILSMTIVALVAFLVWKIIRRKFKFRRGETTRKVQTDSPATQLLPRKRYIASIEISESYFGWAVQDNDDEKIVRVTKDVNNPTRKQPTSILIMENEDLFGYKALRKFIGSSETEELKCTFFHKMRKISNQGKESTLTSIEIYSKILDFIVREVNEKANHEKSECGKPACEIEYVITIPTHWKGTKSLEDFKKAIKKSEEIKGAKKHLIVTKAEVVSPFLHEVKADVLCQNFNVDHLSFEDKTKYAILDIGTTACELTILTSHKNEKDTAAKPYRKEWKKSVEKEYIELLNTIFGLDMIKEFRKHKAKEEDLLLAFETVKTSKDTFRLPEKNVKLPIPGFFKTLMEEKGRSPREKVKNFIQNKRNGIETVSWEEDDEGCSLCISLDEMKQLFDPMLEDIQEMITKHFSNNINNDIKCVCIIGGYANAKLVHKRARDCFPERTVVFPKEADLVVAQGAVYYGYKYM